MNTENPMINKEQTDPATPDRPGGIDRSFIVTTLPGLKTVPSGTVHSPNDLFVSFSICCLNASQ